MCGSQRNLREEGLLQESVNEEGSAHTFNVRLNHLPVAYVAR